MSSLTMMGQEADKYFQPVKKKSEVRKKKQQEKEAEEKAKAASKVPGMGDGQKGSVFAQMDAAAAAKKAELLSRPSTQAPKESYGQLAFGRLVESSNDDEEHDDEAHGDGQGQVEQKLKKKKPKQKKPKITIAQAAAGLDAAQSREYFKEVRLKYKGDHRAALELLAHSIEKSFKEVDLPFHNLLHDKFAKACELPSSDVPGPYRHEVQACLSQFPEDACAAVLADACQALVKGVPERAPGPGVPNPTAKAPVGLLLFLQILLHVAPGALQSGSKTVAQRAAQHFAFPGRLPYLMWLIAQAGGRQKEHQVSGGLSILLPLYLQRPMLTLDPAVPGLEGQPPGHAVMKQLEARLQSLVAIIPSKPSEKASQRLQAVPEGMVETVASSLAKGGFPAERQAFLERLCTTLQVKQRQYKTDYSRQLQFCILAAEEGQAAKPAEAASQSLALETIVRQACQCVEMQPESLDLLLALAPDHPGGSLWLLEQICLPGKVKHSTQLKILTFLGDLRQKLSSGKFNGKKDVTKQLVSFCDETLVVLNAKQSQHRWGSILLAFLLLQFVLVMLLYLTIQHKQEVVGYVKMQGYNDRANDLEQAISMAESNIERGYGLFLQHVQPHVEGGYMLFQQHVQPHIEGALGGLWFHFGPAIEYVGSQLKRLTAKVMNTIGAQ